MSVKVDGNRITMTRGDTLRLHVDIVVDNASYTPTGEDVVRFALKHSLLNAMQTEYADKKPLISKIIPNSTQTLQLDPADTKDLGFGRYDYDIQITFANGTVSTFISDTLTLTKEVE